jgi:DNA-binding response OmpR family regulator
MHDTITRSWKSFSANEPRREASRPVRILIVDSDIDSADSVELMLNASGYSETRVAYTGESARLIAVDFQPRVVLLDLGLLDMSGYELAQSLREQAQSRDLRLIAVTSSTEHPAREEARMAGFERYLVWPVTSLDLVSLLDPSP